jgi:3-phosphoshikimate 1-carboxyvinyltransferase
MTMHLSSKIHSPALKARAANRPRPLDCVDATLTPAAPSQVSSGGIVLSSCLCNEQSNPQPQNPTGSVLRDIALFKSLLKQSGMMKLVALSAVVLGTHAFLPQHVPVLQHAGQARLPHRCSRAAVAKRSAGRMAAAPAATAMKLESLVVNPITKISGEVVLPGSKSLSNRVLLLAALASGTTTIENLLDSDDIRYMLGALEKLGVSLERDVAAKRVVVKGNAGPFNAPDANPIELFLGNAGTAMRPLTAVMCAGEGSFVMDGTPRMRERPIKDLVDGLQQLGVEATCSDTGCPPVQISAKGIPGGVTRVSGQISSQYLSALLMAAPLAKSDVTIEIIDELVSAPYVHMTIKLMAKFGVKVDSDGQDKRFTVKAGQAYKSPGTIPVEGDASSASYFLGGAAITGGPVRVVGCGRESVQGDVKFAAVLEQMGAKLVWEDNAMTVSREPGTKLKVS